MDELGSIWGYQESVDELKQALLYKTLELEKARAQASEEIRRNIENVNQLLQHLKTVYKERDEAREQIRKLHNIYTLLNPQTGITNSRFQIHQSNKANSSITESNSLSDTNNYQSPNDPLFDIVSSPDSSNLGYVNNQHKQQNPFVMDQGSLVINSLAKNKPLPRKGELLQAVLEAGPLLKTLLVAGPLPSWRNPPPIQVCQIPPVSIKGHESRIVNLGQANNMSSNTSKFNGGPCFGGVNANKYGVLEKRQKLY